MWQSLGKTAAGFAARVSLSPAVRLVGMMTRARPVFAVMPMLALSSASFAAESGVLDSSRILDSVEVDLGDHSIFYNRVEAPLVKPPTAPTPALPPRPPTAEELAREQHLESLRQVSLWLSCTVFAGQFTVVRFPQDGREVVFYSTIDFNLLAQGFDLETKDSLYSLYLGLGDAPREDFEGEWPTALLAEAAATGQSQWQVVSKVPLSADSKRTMEDLHRYFDLQRDKLVALRAEREGAQRAHDEWLKARPPLPEDIVINYFPNPQPVRPPR
jgi:hypothetical protein